MKEHEEILAAYRRREHEREKRELWRSVATAIAGSTFADRPEAMGKWADIAVAFYDDRFNPSPSENGSVER